jgi:opacity protein-like surface antigen
VKASGLISGKKTTTDLTYGVGGQYDFNRNLGLRLEWNRYSKVKAPDSAGGGDGDIDVLSVGALWRF